MGIILIIILVLLLIGALPTWGHSRSWGPYPSGGIGLILLILVILLLLGRIWCGFEFFKLVRIAYNTSFSRKARSKSWRGTENSAFRGPIKAGRQICSIWHREGFCSLWKPINDVSPFPWFESSILPTGSHWQTRFAERGHYFLWWRTYKRPMFGMSTLPAGWS